MSAASSAPLPGTVAVRASPVSCARLRTFILAFQRWATTAEIDTVVPPVFLEALASRVLEPQVTLSLHDSFHLQMPHGTCDSSGTTQIFGFYTEASKNRTLTVQHVRRNDNDKHHIDLAAGEVACNYSHWMAGITTTTIPWICASLVPSRERELSGKGLLCSMFDAQRWLDDGRAALVRPADRSAPAVPLCASAARALDEGLTLLLVKGDLVHVRLPGKSDLFFAGMMWREEPAEPPSRSCDVEAFILAERASRRAGRAFDGKVLHAEPGEIFTEDGMFDWRPHDVYEYIPGTWA